MNPRSGSTRPTPPETTARGRAAAVPGTAASALRDLGRWTWGDDDQGLLDGSDWWYRCRFDAPEGPLEGPWQLDLDGLATVADVWLNDEHLLHSENMWVAHQLRVERLEAHNMLLLRFAALAPLLARRRPRPRWRSLLLRSQNQRWYRTTLLGRVQGWAPSGAPGGTLAPRSPSPRRDRADRGRASRACHVRRGRWTRRDPPAARRCRSRNEGRGPGRGSSARHNRGGCRGFCRPRRNHPCPCSRTLVAPHPRRPTAVPGRPDRRRHRPRPRHRRVPDSGGGPCRRRVHALAQRCPHLLPRRALGPP